MAPADPLGGRPVRARYRILGSANESTLVVLDPQARTVHALGPTKDANLYPYGIRAHPGPPITISTRPIRQLLQDLLREVPADGETFLHGTLKAPDTPVVKPDPEASPVLKPGLRELELRYARPRDLEHPAVRTLFVLSGLVLVQTVRSAAAAGPAPAAGAPSEPGTAPAEFEDVTELFIGHVRDPARELLVREGDRVHQGQVLARLAYQDPEFERRRQHAEALLAETQAAFALETQEVRLARALVAAELATADAVAREEDARLRAQEAVAQARRELNRLSEEARRTSEIRAPVDGQILTLRVHVIHGSDGTAVLRLLLSDEDFCHLPALLANRLRELDPERHLCFLTRAASLGPSIYHLSKLLNEMQGKTRVPTILCYPGQLQGANALCFMGLPGREPLPNYRVKIYG